MRRHILGLIALASFVFAAAAEWFSPLASLQTASAMGLRVGSVLGVFWLAWPDLHRLPRWVRYVLPIALVALFYVKQILVLLIPIFVVGAISYLSYRKVWRSSSH